MLNLLVINNKEVLELSARKAKQITNPKDIEEILNLTEDDLLHTHTIMGLFADFEGNGHPRFNPYDTIVIPPGHYTLKNGKKNTKSCLTTIGLWCFNKCFIEPRFSHIFGYINKTINKGVFGDINDELSYALLEDKITVEDLQDFIQKGQFYMKFEAVLTTSGSVNMLTINEKINVKKRELIAKNKEAVLNGDAEVVDEIEQELIAYAKELLKDDPTYDMFDSGAGPDWKNNFKNMFISRGAIKDPDPDKGYNIIMSSYMDSIKKDEFVATANSLVAGPYKRANKTQIGGYWEKLVLSLTQHLTLDKPGSDCGTKKTIIVKMDKANIKDFMYSFIVDNGKLVELNSENKSKYLNKVVKVRYSAMCENKAKNNCICNKCIGNLPYRLTTTADGSKYISNLGAATPQLMSRLKNINMKGFHDSIVKFTEMDPMKAFEGEK